MTFYPNHVEHNSAFQKHPSDDGLAFLYRRSTEILLDVGNKYRLSSSLHIALITVLYEP
jgi:hypothetical protein